MLGFAFLALTPTSAAVVPVMVDGMLCHPRNVMVKLTDSSILPALQIDGYKVIQYMPQIDWAVVESPVGQLSATRRELEKVDGVEMATLDRAAKVAYTPNDPKWPDQWHMRAMKADLAWDITLGSSSVVVAVIDTGVQASHPDLAANIWTNPGEIAGNGIDDDGNGYIDDVHGWDFANSDNNPDDDYGHGTSCAGLVAGVGDNSIGVTGVAPRATIMPIKCGRSDGYFFDSATVPAYIYAADAGARVFSMSYYSDRVSPAEEDGLKYAVAHNVVPVAAAGNDSTVYSYYPGAYESVISVAAVDSNINKAGFSDWGSWVDVAAPGVGLTTTATGSGYTGGFSGTSGACPHVAGLAALMIAANPAYSGKKIRKVLEDTCTPVNQAPFGEYANYGFVDAQAAVAGVTGKLPPSKSSVARWISPIGTVAVGSHANALIYGRSFLQASAKVGGVSATVKNRQRDSATMLLPTTGGTFEVFNGATLAGTFVPPVSDAYVYPLIEGSSSGANVTGGYLDTLNADSLFMKVPRKSDSTVLLQATFRNVPVSGKFTLVLRRKYLAADGSESIQFYNWADASYPYAGFTEIGLSGSLPTSTTESRIYIKDIKPYVDFNHTMYFRMLVSGVASGNELRLDQAYLIPGNHL